MSPRKRVSSLSFVWRFTVVLCTVQIIWPKAHTTPRTGAQITQKSMTTSTTLSGTYSATKGELPSTIATDSVILSDVTKVDPQGSKLKIPNTKSTEKIALTEHSTLARLYTEGSKVNSQTTLLSVKTDENVRFVNSHFPAELSITENPNKVRFTNDANTSESSFSGDPNKEHSVAITSDSFRCSTTENGVDEQPKCNKSDLNPNVSREVTSLRTLNDDILTQVNDSESATVSQSIDYLSRLPNLCPHTNICEKYTQDTTCCRACSCAHDCGDSCCFRNGTKANYRGSKPDCLHVQRELPGKQLSNYRTYKIVRTCQIPEIALFGPLPVMRNNQPSDDSWKYKLSPVFSKITNITYYNSKYAECNDEFGVDIVHWDRIENCGGFIGQTYEDIHNAIHKGNCDTVYNPPAQYRDLIQECYKIDVDACNIAGEWDYYDEQIEQGCEELRFPYIEKYIFDKHRKPTVFANVFCYICNNKRNAAVPEICTEIDQFIDSFTTMLSYTDEDAITPVSEITRFAKSNESKCGDNQILDNMRVNNYIFLSFARKTKQSKPTILSDLNLCSN